MKDCSLCKESKPLTEYSTRKDGRSKLRSFCKHCERELARVYATKHKARRLKYIKSRRELRKDNKYDRAAILYWCILDRIRRDKNYALRKCTFSKPEFLAFALKSNQFHEKFRDWRSGGYQYRLSPSVDRVDSDGDYTLSNIQFLSISENSRKGSENILRRLEK